MGSNLLNPQTNFFLTSVTRFVDQFYNFKIDDRLAYQTIRDSLSSGQIKSKYKIIQNCREMDLKSNHSVFIGHWHGLLPLMMRNENFIENAIGVEKSKIWSEFSNLLNTEWSWQSQFMDVNNFIFNQNTDLVVNTSCEHMENQWINAVPVGCRLILQSTDYIHPEHINLQINIENFKMSLNKKLIVDSEDTLDCGIYKRFTIFGRKI